MKNILRITLTLLLLISLKTLNAQDDSLAGSFLSGKVKNNEHK